MVGPDTSCGSRYRNYRPTRIQLARVWNPRVHAGAGYPR